MRLITMAIIMSLLFCVFIFRIRHENKVKPAIEKSKMLNENHYNKARF